MQRPCFSAVSAAVVAGVFAFQAVAAEPPQGFTALFNGRDLTGWFGHKGEDPRDVIGKSQDELQKIWDASMADVNAHWKAENDELVNDGHGLFLATKKNYRDFEFWVDYKTVAKADSGIYLRGTPQVQIWDTTEEAKFSLGADKGSGGLWNNKDRGLAGKNPSKKMDRPFGEWNSFKIKMIGERVTVNFNGETVVNDCVLENYADRQSPVFVEGPIKLQTHGGEIRWRNIFVREIPYDEVVKTLSARDGGEAGFVRLDNGRDLSGWKGAIENYQVGDGAIRCKAGKGGNLLTPEEYGDFVVRFEFKVPPGGNNGLCLRHPGEGDTAYVGMCESQVLDDNYDKVKGPIDPRQVHGSAYGMVGAKRGFQRPVGEWNYQEVTVKGPTIRVELNGTQILDADLSKVTPDQFMGGHAHPGKDRTKGFFGFAGHSDPVSFRNVRIKKL